MERGRQHKFYSSREESRVGAWLGRSRRSREEGEEEVERDHRLPQLIFFCDAQEFGCDVAKRWTIRVLANGLFHLLFGVFIAGCY